MELTDQVVGEAKDESKVATKLLERLSQALANDAFAPLDLRLLNLDVEKRASIVVVVSNVEWRILPWILDVV